MVSQSGGNDGRDVAKHFGVRQHFFEVLADLVEPLQEGGIAVPEGLDDELLPPLAGEAPGQVVDRHTGPLGLFAQVVMLRLSEPEDDQSVPPTAGLFCRARHFFTPVKNCPATAPAQDVGDFGAASAGGFNGGLCPP